MQTIIDYKIPFEDKYPNLSAILGVLIIFSFGYLLLWLAPVIEESVKALIS